MSVDTSEKHSNSDEHLKKQASEIASKLEYYRNKFRNYFLLVLCPTLIIFVILVGFLGLNMAIMYVAVFGLLGIVIIIQFLLEKFPENQWIQKINYYPFKTSMPEKIFYNCYSAKEKLKQYSDPGLNLHHAHQAKEHLEQMQKRLYFVLSDFKTSAFIEDRVDDIDELKEMLKDKVIPNILDLRYKTQIYNFLNQLTQSLFKFSIEEFQNLRPHFEKILEDVPSKKFEKTKKIKLFSLVSRYKKIIYFIIYVVIVLPLTFVVLPPLIQIYAPTLTIDSITMVLAVIFSGGGIGIIIK